MSVAVSQLPQFQTLESVSLPAHSHFLPESLLHRPEKLLAAHDPLNPIASIRTVHAATLFSGGAVVGGALNPLVQRDLERAASQGVTSLYVIGMWQSTPFSGLWMQHWAPTWEGYNALKPEWVKSSVFSVDDYYPNDLVGSWQNLDIVLNAARTVGIEIIPCFVTNTIGMGGALMRRSLRENPETIMSRYVDIGELNFFREQCDTRTPARTYSHHQETGPSSGEHQLTLTPIGHNHDLYRYHYQGTNGEDYQCFLQINGALYKHAWIIDRPHAGAGENIHCVQLGSEDPFDRGNGSATVWSDTVHRSVHLAETRRQQMAELQPALERFPFIRCDMAHLAGVDAWKDYPRLAAEQGTPVERMLLETYFEHGALTQQDPSISVYGSFLFRWLEREDMNVSAVMWHIHDSRDLYNTHRVVAYVENHDDKGTTYLPIKGAQALIIAASPVESVLWGQNQRIGDEFRIGAQLHIPREDFIKRQTRLLMTGTTDASDSLRPTFHENAHLDYHKFFRRIEQISALPVFRSKDSSWARADFAALPAEADNIFHIARTLHSPASEETDRALVVVDARKSFSGLQIEIDLTKTFGMESQDLDQFCVVDLLSGAVSPAFSNYRLLPHHGSPPPHSYAIALVPKDKVINN